MIWILCPTAKMAKNIKSFLFLKKTSILSPSQPTLIFTGTQKFGWFQILPSYFTNLKIIYFHHLLNMILSLKA